MSECMRAESSPSLARSLSQTDTSWPSAPHRPQSGPHERLSLAWAAIPTRFRNLMRRVSALQHGHVMTWRRFDFVRTWDHWTTRPQQKKRRFREPDTLRLRLFPRRFLQVVRSFFVSRSRHSRARTHTGSPSAGPSPTPSCPLTVAPRLARVSQHSPEAQRLTHHQKLSQIGQYFRQAHAHGSCLAIRRDRAESTGMR